jgi:hypothetical protein
MLPNCLDIDGSNLTVSIDIIHEAEILAARDL